MKLLSTYVKCKNALNKNSGQAMTEYGLIVALIAVVAIGAIAALGPRIAAAFQTVVTQLGG